MTNYLIIFKMIDWYSDEIQCEQRTIVEADTKELAVQQFDNSMDEEAYQILDVMVIML